MTSSHSMRQDELYLFIASRIRPPLNSTVLEFLEKHYAFIVNIKKNTAVRFEFDSKDEVEKMRQKTLNPKKKEIEKLRNLETDTMENRRDKWAKNMFDRFSGKLDNWKEKEHNKGNRFF